MKYKDYLGYTAEAGLCFSVACSKCNKEIKCGSCSPKDIKFCQYCGHKLALEAKFQKLSPGGAISYVEVPDMQHNIPAVLALMQFIYDNIMYAELNTKSDYCQACGFNGEIEIVKDDAGKLIWRCPRCGNTDESKLNVARRTCGYIGSQFWNQGRTQEIKDRVLHVS